MVVGKQRCAGGEEVSSDVVRGVSDSGGSIGRERLRPLGMADVMQRQVSDVVMRWGR